MIRFIMRMSTVRLTRQIDETELCFVLLWVEYCWSMSLLRKLCLFYSRELTMRRFISRMSKVSM